MPHRSILLVILAASLCGSTAWAQGVTLAQVQAAAAQNEALSAGLRHEAAAVRSDGQAAGTWEMPSTSVGLERLGDDTEWTVSLKQSIPLTGAPTSRRTAAMATAASVDATIAVQRRDIVFEASQQYVAALFVTKEIELLQVRLDLMTDAARLVTSRVTAGDASTFELEWVERERHKLELDLKDRKVRLTAKLVDLSLFAPLQFTDGISDEFPKTCSSGKSELTDTEAQRRNILALEAHRDAVSDEWLPNIGIEAGWRGAQTSSFEGGDQFLQGFLVGLEVSLPLWSNVGLREDAAHARTSAARANLRLFEQHRERRLESLRATCQAAVASIIERREAALLGETLRQRSRSGYEAGELTLVEWISADAAALEDQMAALEAERHAATVSIELSRWAGDLK